MLTRKIYDAILAQDLNLLCSVYQLRRTSVQRTLCACVPKIITTFPTPPPDITGVNREARLVKDTLLKYSCYQSRPFDTRT